jgi:glycosyltransferase involved in cell wall biosynthesis
VATGLGDRGHSVIAVGRRGSGFTIEMQEAGVPVYGGWLRFPTDPFSPIRIAGLARKGGIDVAIVGNTRELARVARARRWADIRRIVGRGMFPQRETSPRSRLLCRRHLDGLIVPSREAKRQLESIDWLSRTRIQNMPNGVELSSIDGAIGGRDLRHIGRMSLGLNPDAFVIGVCGPLEKNRGIRHLVSAFQNIATRIPGSMLVIAGAGPEAASLRKQASALPAARSRVLFTERRLDDGHLYPALDAYVLPAVNPNMTFSQTLIQAMAYYVPVVCSDIGGLRETVRDGQNGMLTVPGRADSLAGKLLELEDDPELRRRLARAGRQSVEAYYDRETMLNRIESLFRDISDTD